MSPANKKKTDTDLPPHWADESAPPRTYTDPPYRPVKKRKLINHVRIQGEAYNRETFHRAAVHVSGFPLFFASWEIKRSNRIHHSFFPHPLPTRLCHLPVRMMNFLHCLPILYAYPTNFGLISGAQGILGNKLGNREKTRIANPLRDNMHIMASPALIKNAIRPCMDYDKRFPTFTWPEDHFMSMSPAWIKSKAKRQMAQVLENGGSKRLPRPRSSFYMTQDGDLVSEKPKKGGVWLQGRLSVLNPTSKFWLDKQCNVHPFDPFWTNHNMWCWHNHSTNTVERAKLYTEMHDVYMRYSWGGCWTPLAFLYDTPVRRDNRWAANLLFAGDPASVLLYALHHEMIPPRLIYDDFFIDDRVFDMGPWNLYDEFRIKVLLETNKHLDNLMPWFFTRHNNRYADELLGG